MTAASFTNDRQARRAAAAADRADESWLVGARGGGSVHLRRGETVRITAPVHIHGDIFCVELLIHDDAEVDGTIRARTEMATVGDDPDGKIDTSNAAGLG